MSTEHKAILFDYLCQVEEREQRERVPDVDFLFLASDGTTFWGECYAQAVELARAYDLNAGNV